MSHWNEINIPLHFEKSQIWSGQACVPSCAGGELALDTVSPARRALSNAKMTRLECMLPQGSVR